MVALIQRVRRASVKVEDEVVGSIGVGMLILLGVHREDEVVEADWLARKCAALRIFADEEGKMNRSIQDTGGQALVVSQFTLYGDVSRGNRPSFDQAAGPQEADKLYNMFVERLDEQIGPAVETGVFGAMMDVDLVNDGPVTFWVERKRADR